MSMHNFHDGYGDTAAEAIDRDGRWSLAIISLSAALDRSPSTVHVSPVRLTWAPVVPSSAAAHAICQAARWRQRS